MRDGEQHRIWYVSVAHMMVHMYEMAIPVLLTVWVTQFPVDRAALGAIVTVGYGLYGIGALPAGVLADRFGSERLIVGCLFGMGFAFLLVSLSPSVLALTVALACWGVAGSVYHPAGLSLLSRAFSERGKAFGYHGMGANAGTVAGPLLTAILLFAFDWQIATAMLAIPTLLVGLVGLRMNLEEAAATDAMQGTSDRGGLVSATLSNTKHLLLAGFGVILVVVMFNGLFYRGLLTFLPGILGDMVSQQAGSSGLLNPNHPAVSQLDLGRYLFSGILVIGMGGQYLGGRLTDYIPPEWGMTGVLASLSVMALLAAPAQSAGFVPMLTVATALGFLLFSLQPFTQVTVAEHSAPDLRGLSFGLMYLLVFGVGSFAAAAMGYVLTYSTVTVAFLVLAAIAAVGSAASFVLLQSGDPGSSEADPASGD